MFVHLALVFFFVRSSSAGRVLLFARISLVVFFFVCSSCIGRDVLVRSFLVLFYFCSFVLHWSLFFVFVRIALIVVFMFVRVVLIVSLICLCSFVFGLSFFLFVHTVLLVLFVFVRIALVICFCVRSSCTGRFFFVRSY